MSFKNCSHFTINGGHFVNVERVSTLRVVRHGRGATTVARKNARGNLGKTRTAWDDYNLIKTGDVRIEETMGTTPVTLDYRDDEEGRKQYRLWRNLDAHRNLNIARIRGEDRQDRFLYVTYTGPDAFKAFKQDFDQFARIKSVYVAQIFGYNNNKKGLPALIFYDALIPLGHILFDNDRLSPLLYSHFTLQYCRMQKEISVGELLISEMWVDPRTGALQKGLYVEMPLFASWLMHNSVSDEDTMPHSTYPSLPIQTYTDNDTILEYLTKTFPTRTILRTIWRSSRGRLQVLVDARQVIIMLSYLPGAIYNWRSRDIIARLPDVRERWRFVFWRAAYIEIPDAMRDSQVIYQDGTVRFTVTPTEIQDLDIIQLQYLLASPGAPDCRAESWLAQAHSVFSQLRINRDEWEDYSISGGFLLRLTRTSSPKKPISIPSEVYLFILPVPRPSDDESIWKSWMEGSKYFWSFDPRGRHFELPTFTSKITARHTDWFPTHYDIAQKLQISQGFDPTTTDFALSLGHPPFEVIRDEDRFEDLELVRCGPALPLTCTSSDSAESSTNFLTVVS